MHVQELISRLELQRHPEGGYYSQTFASDEMIYGKNHDSARRLYTSIYFLLEGEDVSRFHRLKSDELWYYHAGSSLTVHILTPDGTYRTEHLGLDLQNGERPQVLVEKGSIFGSTVDESGSFALVGCMVAPGFEFEDFELLQRDALIEQYGEHEQIIRKLTAE